MRPCGADGAGHPTLEGIGRGRGFDQMLDPVQVLFPGMDQHLEAFVVRMTLKLDAVAGKAAGHEALNGLIGGLAR